MFTCTKNVLVVGVSLLLSTSLWADNNKQQNKPANAGQRIVIVPTEIKPSQMATLTSSGAVCPSGRGQALDLALDTNTAERFPFFIPEGAALVITQISHYGSAYLYLDAAGNSTPFIRLMDGTTPVSDTVAGPGTVLCYIGSTNAYKNLVVQGHLVKND